MARFRRRYGSMGDLAPRSLTYAREPLADSKAQGPVPKGTGPFWASFVRCAGKMSTLGLGLYKSASKNDDR